MIEFKQKEFARYNSVSDFVSFDKVTRPTLELIKSIEMMQFENGEYVYHWITDKFIGTIIDGSLNLHVSAQLFLGPAIEDNYNRLSPYIGINNVNTLVQNFENWDGFIEETKKKLLTETSSGKIKYESWFKQNQIMFSNREYKDIIKFIALAISGQIVFDTYTDYWGTFSRVCKQTVDYRLINPILKSGNKQDNIRELKFILANILASVCYVPITYPPINELMQGY